MALISLDPTKPTRELQIEYVEDFTCGLSCWKATDVVCRCSCRGENHGIYNDEGAEDPIRTSKIDGFYYELYSVGMRGTLLKTMREAVQATLLETGFIKELNGVFVYSSKFNRQGLNETWYPSHDYGNEKGFIFRLKYAQLNQCLNWKELIPYNIKSEEDRNNTSLSLLWKRRDL